MNILNYVHLRNIVASTGAGRVARQMTEALAQVNGVNLRVLADAGDHRRIAAAAGDPWTGFAYHFFQHETSSQQTRWFLFETPRAEDYWGDTEIVYCTAESFVPTKRARLAVTLHDAAYFERTAHRPNLAFWKQRLKWRLLYRTLDKRADLLHTVSQFSADRLAHFFPAIRSRLRVVHNAVTARFFEPVSAEGKTYLHDAGLANRPFVLLPGGLHHRKNADLVLAAWPRLAELFPDLQLVVVNHSDPDYAARAQSLAGSVRLAGFVSDEELCALYNSASLVWFPSRYEGFGMPVLEAMACGTPVVASNSSSLPEVAGGAARLAPPGNPDAHVQAIESLLQSGAEREWLSAKGRRRAAGFTWANQAAQLHREFAAIL